MMPVKEDTFMCRYNKNLLTALCENRSETSETVLELENLNIVDCDKKSTPLIEEQSKFGFLNTNNLLSVDNFERLPKSKLKPVLNKTVPTQLNNIYKIDSEELYIRLQKLLSLRNEVCTGSEKVSKGRRKSSVGIKSTESQHSSHHDIASIDHLTSGSQNLKEELTNKAPIQMLSKQKESIGNSELRDNVKNHKIVLPDTLKKKRKKYIENQHKICNLKNLYPGVVIGHRHCIESVVSVPKYMGWLWNITDDVTGYQPQPSWRPGAIPKSVSKIIKHSVKQLHTEFQESFTTQSKMKVKGSGKCDKRMASSGSEIICGPKPLLHLHETKDMFYINMRPPLSDYKNKKEPVNFKIRKDNNDRNTSSSDLSVQIDMILLDEPPVELDQAKEKSKENINYEGQIKVDTPSQKTVLHKKKKGKKASKTGKKK